MPSLAYMSSRIHFHRLSICSSRILLILRYTAHRLANPPLLSFQTHQFIYWWWPAGWPLHPCCLSFEGRLSFLSMISPISFSPNWVRNFDWVWNHLYSWTIQTLLNWCRPYSYDVPYCSFWKRSEFTIPSPHPVLRPMTQNPNEQWIYS